MTECVRDASKEKKTRRPRARVTLGRVTLSLFFWYWGRSEKYCHWLFGKAFVTNVIIFGSRAVEGSKSIELMD